MNRPVRVLRCAIYTRKSTDAGLKQDFNSLDAQREAAEAYIKSQAHEGWTLIPGTWDDGGYSGSSLERPALQRLLDAVRAKTVDVIVVYKVDRLTRSLADFAKLVELFDQSAVSFVSVTQSFNTTTSMGRLTLNVLLSFAQFEREVTAERIRDKIAASKKKGIWMGGPVPLGYKVDHRRLVPEEAEAETVRTIFRLYLETGSLNALLVELQRRSVLTKRTVQRSGRVRGGIPFTIGPLAYLLANRTYVGELTHKGVWRRADHEPIIDRALFEAVGDKLKAQARSAGVLRSGARALLAGLLFDDRGEPMLASSGNRNGVRYGYYVSRALLERPRTREPGSIPRVSAPDLEDIVTSALAEAAIPVLASSTDAKDRPGQGDLHRLLQRVVVRTEHLEITLTDPAFAATHSQPPTDAPTIRIEVPHRFRKAGPRHTIDGTDTVRPPRCSRMRADTRLTLITAIAHARRWMDDLISGRAENVEAIAAREGRSSRHIRAALPLAFVAPELIGAALEFRLEEGFGAAGLSRQMPLGRADQLRLVRLDFSDLSPDIE